MDGITTGLGRNVVAEILGHFGDIDGARQKAEAAAADILAIPEVAEALNVRQMLNESGASVARDSDGTVWFGRGADFKERATLR